MGRVLLAEVMCTVFKSSSGLCLVPWMSELRAGNPLAVRASDRLMQLPAARNSGLSRPLSGVFAPRRAEKMQ